MCWRFGRVDMLVSPGIERGTELLPTQRFQRNLRFGSAVVLGQLFQEVLKVIHFISAGVFLAVAAAVLPTLAENSVRDEDQTLGKRFSISPESLPKPAPEQAVSNPPVTIERGDRQPHVPEGFSVSLFAENLKQPRHLLVLPNGNVLLAEQEANHVLLLRDADVDGRAEFLQLFATGFNETSLTGSPIVMAKSWSPITRESGP